MRKLAFTLLLVFCLSNLALGQDLRTRLVWTAVREGGRVVWKLVENFPTDRIEMNLEVAKQVENQRVLEIAERRYEIARARERHLLGLSGYAEYHNYSEWEKERIDRALAFARRERADAELELKLRTGQVASDAGVPTSDEWAGRTAQQRNIAAKKSIDAQERVRESTSRQREAYERYQDSSRSLGDPTRTVESFREGTQAMKDYAKATNDKVKAIVDKARADRDQQ